MQLSQLSSSDDDAVDYAERPSSTFIDRAKLTTLYTIAVPRQNLSIFPFTFYPFSNFTKIHPKLFFGSTSYETIPNTTSVGVLSTVDLVVLRRDGPRQLREHDDD